MSTLEAVAKLMCSASKHSDIKKNRITTNPIQFHNVIDVFTKLSGCCDYCTVLLKYGDGVNRVTDPDALTIERLDNSFGHEVTNCTLVCSQCNSTRGDYISYEVMKLHGVALKTREFSYCTGCTTLVPIADIVPCRSRCRSCEFERCQLYRAEHRDELILKKSAYYYSNKEDINAKHASKYANDVEFRENAKRRVAEYYETNKASIKLKAKIYRDTHKVEYAALQKKTRDKHKVQRSAQRRAKYAANKDAINKKQREYRALHKDDIKSKAKIWRDANKEVLKERRRKKNKKVKCT
jgi:hypothetical protein